MSQFPRFWCAESLTGRSQRRVHTSVVCNPLIKTSNEEAVRGFQNGMRDMRLCALSGQDSSQLMNDSLDQTEKYRMIGEVLKYKPLNTKINTSLDGIRSGTGRHSSQSWLGWRR
jgi:hypothetical protein